MQILSKGILLVDKETGTHSFRLVSLLRRLTRVEKIGHAGTLDPFATGLMVMLVGREFTQRSDQFLNSDKEYEATLRFGIATDTYDCDGQITERSTTTPTRAELEMVLGLFQGNILQIPPMFSAKKVAGKKLYDLARSGVTIERQPVRVTVQITLISYDYPDACMRVTCSKGTYIRSLAHDIGRAVGSCAHLVQLRRLRSGAFSVADALPQQVLQPGFDLSSYFRGGNG